MYKIPANTLFLGKQLLFVPECHSTNTLAIQMSQETAPLEGTVVITDNQTAGRGQRGNSWEATAGMNLTFSVVLTPTFLEPKAYFYLTMVTSLALCDFLNTKAVDTTFIKWPNDILVHGKKISGILIENQVQGSRFIFSVVGIGFNVNQSAFQYQTATSLKTVVQGEQSLETVLHDILHCLEVRYLQLKQQKFSVLYNEYLSRLYWKDEPHLFSSNGISFEGVIRGIDDAGKLAVETKEGSRYFEIKEITFLS